MKWTIGKKLGMAFTSILLLMVISTVVSNYLGQLVLSTSGHVIEEQYPSMGALDQMTILLYEKRIGYERYFLTREKKHLEHLIKIQDQYDKNLLSYLTLPLSENEWQLINKFSPPIKRYFEKLDEAVIFFDSNSQNLAGTMRLVARADELLDKEIIPIIQELHKYKRLETNTIVDKLKTSLNTSTTVTLIVGIFAIIIGTFLSLFLGQSMSRPIVSLTEAADAISLGDLSKPVTVNTKDEIGDLAKSIDRMRMSLQKAMERLKRRK